MSEQELQVVFEGQLVKGADPDQVFDALPRMQTVRGRMQLAARRENGASDV